MSLSPQNRKRRRGFTLAELLIALAILGVIATFTIPKIITAQQNSAYNSAALEAAATISAAYQQYKATNEVTSNFHSSDLTPYLNYVAIDTVNVVDGYSTTTTSNCTSVGRCLKLHSGGTLQYWTVDYFGGTSTNAVPFWFDPDGQVTDGTTNGPGKANVFWLYANGQIVDYANIQAGTTYKAGTAVSAQSGRVPSWFHWN